MHILQRGAETSRDRLRVEDVNILNVNHLSRQTTSEKLFCADSDVKASLLKVKGLISASATSSKQKHKTNDERTF